jgi:hypothetical protein
VLWAFIIASLGGFGAAAYMMATRAPDAYAQCQSSPLQAVASTAAIVDATDALTETQRSRVRTTIEGERDRLPQGGRLIILSLNPAAPWEPIELVSICNPGTAADANPLFATRSRIEARWRTAYADPIEKAIARAIEGPTSTNSPIVATIAATLTRPDFDARVPQQRRMVLVSDLLEHDKAGYSQLKGGDFWNAYRASTLPQKAKLDLRGVSVAIDYLLRGQYAAVQGPKHQEFWQRLLTEAGAAEVSFIGQHPSKVSVGIKKSDRVVKPSRTTE